MARHPLRRWFLPLLAGTVALAAEPARTPAPPVRAAPTRPAPATPWPSTRFAGTDWIDARELARRCGLRVVWTKPDEVLTLRDARGLRFTFEARQRDFLFDGLRVFLGEPPRAEAGRLWLTRLDVLQLVVPLLRPGDSAAQLPPTRPRVVVLDPGHGGGDPGMVNPRVGLAEKDLTLDLARRLQKLLEAEGWSVLLTRTEDRALSPVKKTDLLRRDDFARRHQADLFLSLHFNSVERDTERVTGIETYSMTPRHMLSTGDETGGDMTAVAYPGNRHDAANLLLGEQVHRALLAELQTPDRGFKRGRLAVLRMLDCPGVLVECGYLSHDAEARRLARPEYRERIARGLAAGVRGYAAALAALRPTPAPPAPAGR